MIGKNTLPDLFPYPPKRINSIGVKEAIFIVAYFVLFGSFRTQLAGIDSYDTLGSESSGTNVYVVMAGVYALTIYYATFRINKVVSNFADHLVLYSIPLLAFVSVLWSVNPFVTLVSSVTYALVFVVGIVTYTEFGSRGAIRIVFLAGIAVVAASVAVSLVQPEIGVHQPLEPGGSAHAGSWRGVFNHRTKLGQFSAFLLLIIFFLRIELCTRRTAVAVCSLAIVCLVMANSAGSFLTVIVGGITGLSLKAVGRADPSRRVLMLMIYGAAILLALLISGPLLDWMLGVLGKDPSLTGRTYFWKVLFAAVGYEQILGFGYVAGFAEVARPILVSWGFDTVPNAQNAYIDIYLAFGIVGLIVFVAVAFAYAIRGIKMILAGSRISRAPHHSSQRRAIAGLVLLVAAAQIGQVESFIVEDSTFLVPLLATLFPALLPSNRRVRVVKRERRLFGRVDHSGILRRS